MTAGVLQSEREKYTDLGMNDLIPKPIDENVLFRVLSQYKPQSDTATRASTSKDKEEKALCVFNVKRINSLTKGNPERIQMFIKSFDSFEKVHFSSIDEAMLALESENYKHANFVYHTLKGVVANFGAENLADKIQYLEADINAEKPLNNLIPKIDEIKIELSKFIAESSSWADERRL